MFDLVQERNVGERLSPHTMVYVVTHGVTSATGGLSDAGENQIIELARSRVATGVTSVYSSPAKDTEATAKILGKEFGAKVKTKDCLEEVRTGKGTLNDEEMVQVLPEMWRNVDHRPKNGESLMEARHRLAECVSEFAGRHRGESIAIVTHTILATLFHTLVKGGNPSSKDWLEMGYASCAAYEYAKGGWSLVMPPDNSFLTEATIVKDTLPADVIDALKQD
ncbi:MAG: histidine phosphatase family protein [Candidatus Thorarchaeota archaeon]